MVYNYYATFVSGMQQVVEAIVRERLDDVVIKKLLDGAVLFETQCSYDKLNFFCFNNIFAVISVIEKPDAGSALESHMRAVCNLRRSGGSAPGAGVISENTKEFRSFRIVCSRENTPAAVDEGIRRDTERYIAGVSGLVPDRSQPDTEFWFLYRREGFSIFMKRLTRHASFEKTLHPGELPPPLAYMLCWLSRPKAGNIAADPFCGYGSIPAERLKRFPAAKFYASDIDRKAVEFSRKKITGGLSDRCVFQQADVYELPALLPGEGLDAIITDPPWGKYEGVKGAGSGADKAADSGTVTIEKFYADMVEIFAGLLKPGGTAVLLSAQKEWLRAGVAKSGKLEIREAIPVLVGGKKATVFVLGKA
jgi:tRNA1(Val) A37 N6-methylase TrmN6